MSHGKSLFVVLVLVVAGGAVVAKKYFVDKPPATAIAATVESFPVRSAGDAADDVAICVDPADPGKSLVVGADKEAGLAVYDMKGNELEFVPCGKVNNVDLRRNVKLGGRELTLVITALDDDYTLQVFELAAEKPYLRELPGGKFEVDISTIGLALHRDPATGSCAAIVLGKDRDPRSEALEKLDRLKNLAEIFDAKSDKKDDKKKKAEKGEKVAKAESADAAHPKRLERQKEYEELKKQQDELTQFADTPAKKGRQNWAVRLELTADDSGRISFLEKRRLHLDSKSEGCVVDDETGWMYVAEESRGVWKFHVDGAKDAVEVGERICKVDFPNPLRADVEGIALMKEADGKGYLVISSQGSEDFVVIRREAPHEYVGRFKITSQGAIDGVEDCDGLDGVTANLGPGFEDGALIFQDEKNQSTTGEKVSQNFKFVPWSAVKAKLGL